MSHLHFIIDPLLGPKRIAAFCCTTDQQFEPSMLFVTGGVSRLRERSGGNLRLCGAALDVARIVRHVPNLSLISRERLSDAQLVSRIAIIACAPTVRLIGYFIGSLRRSYLGLIVISTAASGPR
jgi:hypothetical protein